MLSLSRAQEHSFLESEPQIVLLVFFFTSFSFHVPFKQLKTSLLVRYLGEMDIEAWLVLLLCNQK